ncbi:cytochrome c oxidase assembly protein (plasmid) [Aminobacter sp. BA135]|uniref:cytochrome c oxidase assembly protein n=1 Tax=Aminobacter sp. BA135 TaxID=537596 RepID=UPI003D7B27E6
MRGLALTSGVAMLALIWLGPLLGPWRGSFAAHMLAHMGVIAIAAPLIALGLPQNWRPRHSMPLALPIVASLLELVAVWGWHAPVLRGAAETSPVVTATEQLIFLAVGLLLWSTSFAAPTEPRHVAVGTSALLLTSIHMTLLGALLGLSPRPLYGSGEVTCFGIVLDAGQDQQIGGVVMLMIGAVVYLAGGLFLMAHLVKPSPNAREFPPTAMSSTTSLNRQSPGSVGAGAPRQATRPDRAN